MVKKRDNYMHYLEDFHRYLFKYEKELAKYVKEYKRIYGEGCSLRYLNENFDRVKEMKELVKSIDHLLEQ